MQNLILVKDLAIRLGMDRSHTLKLVKALNIETKTVRTPETGMQASSAVSKEDAAKMEEWRSSRGFSKSVEVTEQRSFLYAILPDPVLRPGRVKVGKATTPDNRFADYKTICPEMQVLRVWPAPPSCEGYLIALADTFGLRVGVELFDIGSGLDSFMAAADSALAALSAAENDE
jgi:hypothetical protein